MSAPSADASAFPPPAAQPAPERPPRPAATIVVVRDGAGGIEVLLSRRADGTDYTSGAWVFPGGIVDARDRDAHAACFGIDDAAASARLGLEVGGLDFFVAAIRECFEESGLLFGRAVGDRDDALDGEAADRLAPWRGALHRREHGIAEMCAKEGIRLDAGALVYLSHWLTPLGRAKRYDTRFFIAAAPASQVALFDGTEMVEQLWIAPAEALARSKTLKLLTPTQKTLELVSRFRRCRRADGLGARAAPGAADDAARRRRQPGAAAGDAGRARLRRARPHRPGRSRPRLLRHRSRPPGAALGAGDPRHRRQRQRHDRPRHQHLPGRRRTEQRMGGDRSRARRSPSTSRRSSPPRPGPSPASSRPTPTPTTRRRPWR